MANLGAATEQHDVRTAVAEVCVWGEALGGVVSGAGVWTDHDVGEPSCQLLPVLLVYSYRDMHVSIKGKVARSVMQKFPLYT